MWREHRNWAGGAVLDAVSALQKPQQPFLMCWCLMVLASLVRQTGQSCAPGAMGEGACKKPAGRGRQKKFAVQKTQGQLFLCVGL